MREQEPGSTAVRETAVLDGRVRLLQPIRGYRAGLDAALLAAACDAAEGERVLEAGCGVGAALLAAALRQPAADFVGVERDGAALELALRNIELNGLGGRVAAAGADVAQPFRALMMPRFDLAMSNPPYFDDPDALRAPDPTRRGAWISDPGLARWCGFMLEGVRDGGRLLLVHRADRLPDLLAALAPKAGALQVRPVHAFADAPAKRVLVRAIRGGRAPFRLLPPLILHDRSGPKHTPEAEALLRGRTALSWT